MKANENIRKMARSANIPLWRIAREMNVSEPTMTRWLRNPLAPEKERKIISVIKSLEQEVS